MDHWHRYTTDRIRAFIESAVLRYAGKSVRSILNLGSGGVDYYLPYPFHIHLDLAPKRLANVRHALLGTIESIPFESSSIDVVICVGQVLNFSSPSKSIAEISRVLKPGGLLILEFESNKSLEFLFTDRAQRHEARISTFYNGHRIRIRVYSPSYIQTLLKYSGLTVIQQNHFHILSSLLYRLTGKPGLAARLAVTDYISAFIPYLRRRGCNVILAAMRGI